MAEIAVTAVVTPKFSPANLSVTKIEESKPKTEGQKGCAESGAEN